MHMKEDDDIAAAWAADGIEWRHIGGVWIFVRWDAKQGRAPALGPLAAAWAAELGK
jgi:hypothetical protein